MTDSTTRSSRNKSVKMQLTAISLNLPNPTVSTGLTSPTDDFQDESTNKLIAYLHSLAGNHEVEANMIMKDHNYARPWNWKPESVFVRPIKKIFFSKSHNAVAKEKEDDDLIDVEEIDEEPPVPPFDLSKIRQTMAEFQRVSNFIRTEDVDDWEEKIDKILWSPVQKRIFDRVANILSHERMVRLTKEKTVHEPILRRTSIDLTAKKFREALSSAHWDWRVTQWLHSLLFDHLPQDYLTIYLDILQSLRQKIPQLIDKMITVQPNGNSKGNAVTWETLGPLLKKSWDPVAPMLNVFRPKKLPGNPVLIIIPNGMSSSVTSRQHKWTTQLGMLGTVVTVNANLSLNANRMTVLNTLEQLVQASRTKIQDVKVELPNRPIILIGFNTGAGIACQVGLSEHVTAIVCLGFPLSTVDGKRGSSDDLMLDLRCSVMFVIGEKASVARVDDVEAMRERMLVPTSLVVVGSADDQLRIPTSKKMTERLSQGIVDRCVLEEIADFVGGVLTQPTPMPVRTTNPDNKNRRTNDSRKRKNSTSSCSLDSEPQSPCVKRGKTQSPSQANVHNNVSGISTNAPSRGAMVKLTGTQSTQTPKRKARVNFHNFSEQQNIDNSTGGITLNIGSLASLAPVGPIRFESTPISLQVSPAGTKAGTVKTSTNTCIKVTKGNQVNTIGGTGQNVGKIKMLMPTKKATSQRASLNHKNINVTEKMGDKMSNAPNNVKAQQAAAATIATKASAESASNFGPLPGIQTTKSTMNSIHAATAKSTANVVFAPKNTTVATSATLASLMTPSKVTDGKNALIGCNKRQQVQLSSSGAKARSTTQTSRSSKTSFPSSFPKSSSLDKQAKQAPHNAPTVQSMTVDKSATKRSSESIDTNRCKTTTSRDQLNPSIPTNINLDVGLENILDIPIIIAKDDENLKNFGSLSKLDTPSLLSSTASKKACPGTIPPPLKVCSNKVYFINSRVQPTLIQPQVSSASRTTNSAQTQIKYTQIILTKRTDVEEKSNPVMLSKNNGRTHANKLLFIERKTDVKYIQAAPRLSEDFLGELQPNANESDSNKKA
ncbi:KAT8 regulatory NSL complex subunit 3 isoform X2 [Copidosoma floridanum]|uniref:KAT8 regulatory NSL complex subunit 3 isoform X2 n=1 Tax=Copidosoma floridanum TaxID=29053 RepID=UPI0006C98776|nr:KAT8 regulatory NSL complex subunit 3 isoform X2 [Copidosoma floridanum]